MRSVLFVLVISLLLHSCAEKENADVDVIVDKAIASAGGDALQSSLIGFDFRGRRYEALRDKGTFFLDRYQKDSVKQICDVLSNEGFRRYINSEEAVVPDSLVNRYKNSVNSVHYFSVLPYGLNDGAVNKEYLGEVAVKDKQYHKVKVTFDQEGGGDDFEDVFVYWIDKENYHVDYLAYEYHVNGGGMRFREAINQRTVEGIRFVDYNNYKPEGKETTVYDLDRMFESGSLKLLSKIALENIEVEDCLEC